MCFCLLLAAQLRTKLARTGHTGTVAGRLLVVAGGIIRDGFPDTHVLVVTLDTLDVCMCVPPVKPFTKLASTLHHAHSCRLPHAPARPSALLMSVALPCWRAFGGRGHA